MYDAGFKQDSVMYGQRDIGKELEIEIGEERARITRVGDLCRYERSGVEKLFTCGDSIYLYPLPPINVPVKLFNHIYFKLENSIAIGPEEEVEGFIAMPVEVGVFASSEGGIIDILSPKPPKYALYGSPEQGLIGRYVRTRFYKSRFEADTFTAVTPITITNTTDNWVEITRIVVPAVRVRLYYRDSNVRASSIHMSITSRATATISVTDKAPRGYVGVPPYRQEIPLGLGRFTMEWGI